jgi:hypothetical protein
MMGRVDEPGLLPVMAEEELANLMNGPVREKLVARLPGLKEFENRYDYVRIPLASEFNKPVVDVGERALL